MPDPAISNTYHQERKAIGKENIGKLVPTAAAAVALILLKQVRDNASDMFPRLLVLVSL